jgi:hypothetical protein
MIRPALSAHMASSLGSTYHSSTPPDGFVNGLTNDSLTDRWSSHESHHLRLYLMTFHDYVMNRLSSMWAEYSACESAWENIYIRSLDSS